MSTALTEASIKRASLAATELERDGEMRYELSRAKLNLSHKYTREVAENHQASSLLRRDLVALVGTLKRESQSRAADSDRQIRKSAQLLVHLGKMIREQAAAAPPTPPPPLDVSGLGIALINAIGMVGSAWGPNRPQLPLAQTPPLVPATVQPKPTEPPTPPNIDNKEEQTDRTFQTILELEMQRAGGDESLVIDKFLEAVRKIKGRAGKGPG